MRTAIRSGRELLESLELSDHRLLSELAERDFPVFVPRPFLQQMERGKADDPLLLQVLPRPEELAASPNFLADPVGDGAAQLIPGLLRKYESRALLITTGACAIHCRYCFRRHFPYETTPRSWREWQPALDRIRELPEIDEVILSGGDPLTLVDAQLAPLARQIAKIPHVQRLRLHTRLPIVIPQRVNRDLLDWLTSTRLTPVVVVHANHPREISEDVAAAFARFISAGVPVLNQAVLLRDINDNICTLVELQRKLVNLRVMPYYLHQLDRVQGAGHFEVPLERGLELVAEMRRLLPGYAVPRFVQEIANEPHKTVLA